MSNKNQGDGVIDEPRPDVQHVLSQFCRGIVEGRPSRSTAELFERIRRITAALPVVKAVPKKERKSRALPTKAIKERIAAARELGLRVTGILPDGTVTLDGAANPNATQDDPKELRRLL